MKDYHVYCTKCIHGEESINNKIIDKCAENIYCDKCPCRDCDCRDPEDSMLLSERPKYIVDQTV